MIEAHYYDPEHEPDYEAFSDSAEVFSYIIDEALRNIRCRIGEEGGDR